MVYVLKIPTKRGVHFFHFWPMVYVYMYKIVERTYHLQRSTIELESSPIQLKNSLIELESSSIE